MELQIGNSVQLRILYVIETAAEDSLMFEKHVQGVCKLYGLEGEWFEEGALDHLLRHPWYKENMIPVEVYRKQQKGSSLAGASSIAG